MEQMNIFKKNYLYNIMNLIVYSYYHKMKYNKGKVVTVGDLERNRLGDICFAWRIS